LSYSPHCWSLAELKMDLVVTTSAAPTAEMLELAPGSAIAAAKKRAAITRTTRAPGKLTVHERFTAASSLVGAAAAFSVAARFLIFCLALACCRAADFFAFVSALSASSFAYSFAALTVNSFAVSSASKDSWRKFFGMRIEMPKPSA
jgi:hypothetical protein